jgi:hypothetical protein
MTYKPTKQDKLKSKLLDVSLPKIDTFDLVFGSDKRMPKYVRTVIVESKTGNAWVSASAINSRIVLSAILDNEPQLIRNNNPYLSMDWVEVYLEEFGKNSIELKKIKEIKKQVAMVWANLKKEADE